MTMAASSTTTTTPPDVERAKPNLSSNDSAVLQALFDAESAPSPASSVVQTDASLPPLPQISPSDLPGLQERELQAIRPLQQDQQDQQQEQEQSGEDAAASATPSQKTIETAISDLSAIIASQPEYASAYVNRAQALRMLIDADLNSHNRDRGSGSGSSSAEDTTHTQQSVSAASSSSCARLLDDLSRAITLLTPNSPTTPVSPLQARILSNAHTHRAYLLYRASRSAGPQTQTQTQTQTLTEIQDQTRPADTDETTDDEVPLPRELAILPAHLRRLGPERLEEMASWDFQQGGRYGNPVAKQLAVHTNPYAKMCGAIVRDAMRAEIEEWMGRGGVSLD